MSRGKISWVEYLKNLGYETEDTGWLPLIESGQYLKNKMEREETLFVWSSSPVSYCFARKRPTTSFVQNYPLLDYQFMLPTSKGWQFDFEANRQKLVGELADHPPDYLLIHVLPEQIFDQLFLFGDFSSFIGQNYEFEEKFGNILIYKKAKEKTGFEGGKVISLEIVKRFATITDFEEGEQQSTITFEPMVNPNGVLRSFKVTYPEIIKINFEPVSAEFLGQDGRDFVGNAVFEPSGVVDLHIKVKGLPKSVSFVRVKMGNLTWNNRSYGVNRPLKVVQKGKTFEIYFIYEDGTISRQ